MEPRSNHGQPNWLGTWRQDRCHQVLASRRLCSDVTYGEEERDTQRGDSASPVCPIAADSIRPLWCQRRSLVGGSAQAYTETITDGDQIRQPLRPHLEQKLKLHLAGNLQRLQRNELVVVGLQQLPRGLPLGSELHDVLARRAGELHQE